MGQPVDHFSSPNYKNWLKVGMALQLTTKAMIPLCEGVINPFHDSLKTMIGSTVCQSKCTTKDMKNRKFTCASNVCHKWHAAIDKQLVLRNNSLDNTTVYLWPSHPWQIAQFFMSPGQDANNTKPHKTDPGGILQLMMNCREFSKVLLPDDTCAVKKVKDIRNRVMHSDDYNFLEVDMKIHLQSMTDLLKMPPIQTYYSNAANEAIIKIDQIKKLDINISDETVLEHERNLWKSKIAAADTTHRMAIKKTLDSNKDLHDRLIGVYKELKKDIDDLKCKDEEKNVMILQLQSKDEEKNVMILQLQKRICELENKQKEKPRTELRATLKKKMQEKYRHIKFGMLEKFVELDLQLETPPDVEELERPRPSNPVSLLQWLEGETHKRVLIRGRAGVGKTTHLENIAREWATENCYHDVDYVFVIKLCELLPTVKWSLSDLLLDDLHLANPDKSVALDEICQNAKRVLLLIDGLDQYPCDNYKAFKFPNTSKVTVSTIIASIISCNLLPEAKVIVSSRHTDAISSNAFGCVIVINGFTEDGVKEYVNNFCAGNEQLRDFILKNIDEIPNTATFCHTPVHSNYVCKSLKNMFSHSESCTMTRLYTKVMHNLGQNLHPLLRNSNTDPDLETNLSNLKETFLKHAELAKDSMTPSLKPTFYDDDLRRYHFDDYDKQAGFLSGSRQTDPNNSDNRRNCWKFSHSLLQEFFAAVGLLLGKCDDFWKRIEDKHFLKQYEIVIIFMAGLLGNKKNEYFLKNLHSTGTPQEFCKTEFIKQLKKKLKSDPLKIVKLVFETQCEDLVDNLPEKIKLSKMNPVEMLSLGWVMVQRTCPVASLEMSARGLDNHLMDQLCNALKNFSTLQKLMVRDCGMSPECVSRMKAEFGDRFVLVEDSHDQQDVDTVQHLTSNS